MKRLLKIVSFGYIGAVVLVLIAATLLESLHGSSFAIDNIYHSSWFIALWALLAITVMIYILYTSRRATLVMLHASFVVILLGALVSFMTSKNGHIAIAHEGAPASMFTTRDGALEKLPFRLQLTALETQYRQNSETPADYVATIIAGDRKEQSAHTVSLNRPLKFKDYRFCINGVSDGNLSLTVSYDRYGRPISYAGYLMVFLSFMLLFFDRQSGFRATLLQLRGERKVKEENGSRFSMEVTGTTGVLLCATALIGMLWYRRGVFPATSGAETLLLLAVVIAVISISLRSNNRFINLRRVLFIVACACIAMATFGLDGNSDVQPILRTPLLGIHVTTIIIAYALLACTAVNAIIALCTKEAGRRAQQALLGRALLYPATMLLATGIFIGAVWADISWGRYWGWDPKEVWALVTLLVCSAAFHTRSLRFMTKPVAFHLFCIVAFAAVLFTYFGVNYLLGGLHSYI